MIYMFLANGMEEVEALTPLDLLRRAGVAVTTVGIGGEEITGSHGITIRADMPDTLYRDGAPDGIILPGGMPGTKHLDASPIVDAALKAAARRGALIAAICAAPMVLGKRGLLKGYKATCYPGFEQYLDGADVGDVRATRVVSDRDRITAAGMGAAFAFGLALVTKLCGKEKADELAAGTIGN